MKEPTKMILSDIEESLFITSLVALSRTMISKDITRYKNFILSRILYILLVSFFWGLELQKWKEYYLEVEKWCDSHIPMDTQCLNSSCTRLTDAFFSVFSVEPEIFFSIAKYKEKWLGIKKLANIFQIDSPSKAKVLFCTYHSEKFCLKDYCNLCLVVGQEECSVLKIVKWKKKKIF